MPLSAFLRSLRSILTHPSRLPEYNFDCAALSLFDSRGMTMNGAQQPEGRSRYVLKAPPVAPSTCDRSELLSFSPAEVPALDVDVGNQTVISVLGSDADNYTVRFRAQAGGATEDEARRALEKIALTRVGPRLSVSTPTYSRERPTNAWLHIDAARNRPVTLNGRYSYMELFGIDATVRVSTTHARIKLIDVAGDVQATARVGAIDFAGNRGQIQLTADGEIGEINLKVAAQRFEGTLEAEADVAIRVLLPPGFESPFEATVDRADLFVCRADMARSVRRRHDRDGAAVFSYGRGKPVLRLVSHGALVIDSTEGVAVGVRQELAVKHAHTTAG